MWYDAKTTKAKIDEEVLLCIDAKPLFPLTKKEITGKVVMDARKYYPTHATKPNDCYVYYAVGTYFDVGSNSGWAGSFNSHHEVLYWTHIPSANKKNSDTVIDKTTDKFRDIDL